MNSGELFDKYFTYVHKCNNLEWELKHLALPQIKHLNDLIELNKLKANTAAQILIACARESRENSHE